MAGIPKKTTTVTDKPKVEKKAVSATEKEVEVKNDTVNEVKTETRTYSKKVKIPQDYEIPIKSNVQGLLVYVSKKTGYEIEWGQMGDVAYIEYSELIAMRNTSKKFFEDNWIIIEDCEDYTAEQILYTLNVDKYYSKTLELDSADDIFSLDIEEIKNIIPTLSEGYKKTVVARALALIRDGDSRLDSNSKVKTLEELLGVKFNEEI